MWARAVFGEFVFDDAVNVVGNRWIADWHQLPNAFTHHAAGFDPGFDTSFYRPLMHVLYAAVYAVAGLRPWAFHLLNLALHVIAVLAAYVLTGAVLRRWSDPQRYRAVPFISALVFAVHPAHVEAVAWIAGITDLSYTAFALGALIAYMRAFSRPGAAWISAGLLWASLLCKETAAVVLLLMPLLESVEARKQSAWSPRAMAMRLTPGLVVTLCYVLMRIAALGSFAPSVRQHPHTAAELIATGAALLSGYLEVLIAPWHQSVMRHVAVQSGFAEPSVIAGVVAFVALLVVAIRFHHSALAPLSIAFILAPILPALFIPAIESGGSIFGERYLYLPVLGVAWCIGVAIEHARQRFALGATVSVTMALVVLLPMAVAAVTRIGIWKNSLTFWTAAVADSPQMAITHEGLCYALYTANRFSAALKACDEAVSLDPTRTDARINRANTLLALGDAKSAVQELDVVLSRRPTSSEALISRGLAFMMLARTTDALDSYARALAIAPESAEAHNDLGVALVRLGRAAEGIPQLEAAVRLAPDNPEYRANLEACQR